MKQLTQDHLDERAIDGIHDKSFQHAPPTTEQHEENPLPPCFGTMFDETAEECSGCGKRAECQAKQNGVAPQDEPAVDPEPAPRLPFHEYSTIFPLMSPDEFKALTEDLRENGLREPITIHDGKIVDGRNRYEACLKLGIEPTLVPWDEREDLIDFVISRNLHRRHLTESQRAMVAAKLKPLFEKAAKERQGMRTDLKVDATGCEDQEPSVNIVANLPQCLGRKAREDAAMVLGVSPRSVQSADTVLKSGSPELAKAVEIGKVKVSAAEKIAKLPIDEQPKAIEDSREKPRKTPDKADSYQRAFIAYKQAIADAKRHEWQKVSREEVTGHIMELGHLVLDKTDLLAA